MKYNVWGKKNAIWYVLHKNMTLKQAHNACKGDLRLSVLPVGQLPYN